ncbi:MAG: ribonuclease HI [Clostridia bacterium]|nr:ribonuclease HI [Clostridia bacterium]
MNKVDIYTDGACSGNPGVGGWGVVLIYKTAQKELSGYDKQTTNNRMEMFAVIQALRALKKSCEVTLYTDSAYVADAFNKKWLEAWQKNGWKTSGNADVKNVDLWKALLYELNMHEVTFVKVKGHADNEFNNRCDCLARAEIDKCRSDG